MSEINPVLTYESSEWRTSSEAMTALAEGGDAITKLELDDCKCSEEIRVHKNVTFRWGNYDKVIAGDGTLDLKDWMQSVDVLGAHMRNLTLGFNTVGQITDNLQDISSRINTVTIEGRAMIGSAFIGYLTVGILGFVKIYNAAEIGDLDVYGTVILYAKVGHIRLHAGGKINNWTHQSNEIVMANIVCDEGRRPVLNEQGWICG